MDGMTSQEWISTGKAAKLMGYSRDHFRDKFQGVIPSRRVGSGHFKWLLSAVRVVVGDAEGVPHAS